MLLAVFLMIGATQYSADSGYREGIDALYSLDFAEADRRFETLRKIDPENPRSWNNLASAAWLQVLHKQQKLQLSAYSDDDSARQAAVDPQLEARLRYDVSQAIAKAERNLKAKPDDVDSLYCLGVSYGILASFEASAKGSYLSANASARRARDLHMRVLARDPAFSDARLLPGMYRYVIGTIPFWARLFLGLAGVRGGDKTGGIADLEFVAEHGKWTSTDAMMLLAVVYSREKQYERSLALVRKLESMYPRNYLLAMEEPSILGKLGQWDRAVERYEQVLQKVKDRQDDFGRLGTAPVYFAIGTANMQRHNFDAAISSFIEVVKVAEAEPDLKANAHLWLGKMYDTSGRRQKAIAEYDAVLSLNCSPAAKDEARKLKRRPFGG